MRPHARVTLSLAAMLAAGVAAGEDGALGETIYRAQCANCHGSQAEGGEGGDYPRLAGQSAEYLRVQLDHFRELKRQNKPMLPIFDAGGLQPAELEAVTAYLAALPLPAQEAVGVPQAVAGDLELGFELYEKDCQLCHGLDARGIEEKGSPQLIAQHPRYLAKQIADFRDGARWHEFAEKLFGEAYEDELDAVLAYILHLNHRPPARGG